MTCRAQTSAERSLARKQADAAELARARRTREVLEEMPGQKFGGGVNALELRQLVELAIVERDERLFEHFVGARDVDDDAMGVEFIGEKGHANDERRAMHLLRRAENVPVEGVGNHDLVGDFNRVHGFSSASMCVIG